MKERRQDFELLQRFARQGQQPAFTDVVQRHLDLVYAKRHDDFRVHCHGFKRDEGCTANCAAYGCGSLRSAGTICQSEAVAKIDDFLGRRRRTRNMVVDWKAEG